MGQFQSHHLSEAQTAIPADALRPWMSCQIATLHEKALGLRVEPCARAAQRDNLLLRLLPGEVACSIKREFDVSERPTVPRNVERMLWAESIGHCMNPECQTALIEDTVSIGEMAHITSHQKGGGVSFDNLLLLCRNCHISVDSGRSEATIQQLKEWKRNRNSQIEEQFTTRLASFDELKLMVVPILKRNRQIFDSYGPNDNPQDEERHKLWRKFEGELILNNKCLEIILMKNIDLLHKENQEIVERFVSHAQEFIMTRDEHNLVRAEFFPQELLSVFGLAKISTSYPPNFSALQNFISDLVNTNRLIELQPFETPFVTYFENGTIVTLELQDRPRFSKYFGMADTSDGNRQTFGLITGYSSSNGYVKLV